MPNPISIYVIWAERLISDALAAFLGGLSLAGCLFWLRENRFALPKADGRWFIETLIKNTAYNPDRGMRLKFVVLIWQEGPALRGTTEKIYEASVSDGKRRYNGKDRIRGELSGYIHKFYFSKDRMQIHLQEESEVRKISSMFDLVVIDREALKGTVVSMVGSMSGTTVWSRDRYSSRFSEDVRREISDQYGPNLFLPGQNIESD